MTAPNISLSAPPESGSHRPRVSNIAPEFESSAKRTHSVAMIGQSRGRRRRKEGREGLPKRRRVAREVGHQALRVWGGGTHLAMPGCELATHISSCLIRSSKSLLSGVAHVAFPCRVPFPCRLRARGRSVCAVQLWVGVGQAGTVWANSRAKCGALSFIFVYSSGQTHSIGRFRPASDPVWPDIEPHWSDCCVVLTSPVFPTISTSDLPGSSASRRRTMT